MNVRLNWNYIFVLLDTLPGKTEQLGVFLEIHRASVWG